MLIPTASRDDVNDTIDSILQLEPSCRIFVVKDFDEPLIFDPRVTVIPPLPWRRNSFGGLLQKKLWALDFIIENANFEYLLTLDADALFIRSGVTSKIDEFFSSVPNNIGAAGCHRVSPSGELRDFRPARRILLRRLFLYPFSVRGSTRALFRLVHLAKANGLELGEHPLGAAVFFRREMLLKWKALGWLKDQRLSTLPIPDDHLLGLMIFASGFSVGEIGGPGGLISVKWIGLPAHPNFLLKQEVFIVHSVRSFENLTELEIRVQFQKSRNQFNNAISKREK